LTWFVSSRMSEYTEKGKKGGNDEVGNTKLGEGMDRRAHRFYTGFTPPPGQT